MNSKLSIFWLRRDLRLEDNVGLFHALKESPNVLPLFIFDSNILDKIENKSDPRVNFIYQTLLELKKSLRELGTDILIEYGPPLDVFKKIILQFKIQSVYTNNDDEPYAIRRDNDILNFLKSAGIVFKSYKDQSLFDRNEITKDDGGPYTVFTAYKNKVLKNLKDNDLNSFNNKKYFNNFERINKNFPVPSLEKMGFKKSHFVFPERKIHLSTINNYAKTRDFPFIEKGTSHLGLHLRFGTLSVRKLAKIAKNNSDVFLSELIWRDFFKQILWHHPRVVNESFRPEYDKIHWRKSKSDFNRWAEGSTGYPIVDAGMRELNKTGYMHNRVRMITASFLTKHLLIHWSEGEAYFAKQLLDFDLSANNGNWQWAAGSGCDAAPYFRIFNPATQTKKFDPDFIYIKKWVPEYRTNKYPEQIIDHAVARQRCLLTYSRGLK